MIKYESSPRLHDGDWFFVANTNPLSHPKDFWTPAFAGDSFSTQPNPQRRLGSIFPLGFKDDWYKSADKTNRK
jgi:hypothetical protein